MESSAENHFATACKTKETKRKGICSVAEMEEEPFQEILSLSSRKREDKQEKQLFATMLIGERPVKFQLNKALRRQHFPLPTIDDVIPDLTKARVFTVCDVKDGFWHIRLSEESSYLTTFAMPFGRYRWIRMPMGISPAPEVFQHRLTQALEGLPGIQIIADDILVCGEGDNDEAAEKDHDAKLRQLLDHCRNSDLVLQCDSSETGLGAALLQAGQPVAYSSRAFTPTEKGYAQIEKECLAILFGMEKFHQYTYGRTVEVHSDHKPLETIVRKPLLNAPKRLQRMLLRLQRYDINVVYVPG